jgi:hypothetical protein
MRSDILGTTFLAKVTGEQRVAPACSLHQTQPIKTDPSASRPKLDICADIYAPEIQVWVIAKAWFQQLRKAAAMITLSNKRRACKEGEKCGFYF